jgi:hypothetical protein
MNFLRDNLLRAYYLATLPQREWSARERSAHGTEPVSVLFYHRVADVNPNGWTMPTKTFARKIRGCKQDLTLSIWRKRATDRRRQKVRHGRHHVDDGYAENLEFAVPLLVREQVPFTYFVSTNRVRQSAFPHDVGRPAARTNTVSQLHAMAAAGVEIALHNRNHVHLGVASPGDW